MSPIVRWSLRFAVPLAAVSFLSACTSGDREQPLTQVEPIEVPAADTTTTVNININNPILTIPNTFSVSDGDLLTLVWSDEFDAAQLDPQVWFFETGDGSQYGIPGWGNNELQYYLPDNASLENGVLKIEARRETVGDFGFTSARINTRDRFAFKYGRIEASIKFPSGQGLWPAFWMLPQDNDYICPAGNPCNWAAIGEIDIVEAVNLDGTGGNEIFGTIHYGGEAPGDLNSETKYTPSEDVTAGFNTYALEWDEFEIRWYFNGTLYAVQNDWYSIAADFPAPFDQNFHILLNLAVGGNFPGSPDGTTPSPATMEVDWVRVYSGEASMAEPVDPGIIPDAGVYVSDPGTMNEDLGPPGGIQNFGSGAAFADVSDANFDRILQVTSGEGYGAGSHVGFAAFTGYDAGFAAGYDTLDFKVKGDAANLAAFEVKLFANPGDPETSRTYDATSFTELGDGWYQVSVPISDFPTADTNFGFLLGPVGAAAAQFTFQMTDIGFSVGGGGGVDPGITPEAVAYSSDPAVAEDFGPPGGIQNFGSGAVFVDILDDPDFAKVLETTSGEGYGA
ncbi:MAG: glycoside hydrolase family 16 protein, partial [Xanthomonadales bacterium]|nr:glycoside hydrolase family 16 protein [Xanthomonadales bacterium]